MLYLLGIIALKIFGASSDNWGSMVETTAEPQPDLQSETENDQFGLMLENKNIYCEHMEEIIVDLKEYIANPASPLPADQIKSEIQSVITSFGGLQNELDDIIDELAANGPSDDTRRLVETLEEDGQILDNNGTIETAPDRRRLSASQWYGGSGGSYHHLKSSVSSAYVTSICARSGSVVDAIKVGFNTGLVTGWYGGSGGSSSCFYVSSGDCIRRAYIRDGSLIDALKVYAGNGRESPYWGGSGGGSHWSSGVGCLKSIEIRSGTLIDAMQFNWHD